jgi:glycosyltransferase involved in cell wall biosynthesis
MRILQVNKFFYVRGGSERYYFDLCDLLSRRGHEVLHFSMKHSRNRPSPQDDHFMPYVDLNASMNLGERLAAASRILYSREAIRRMEALIARYSPDIVHLHNITRQISPSILAVISRRGIPTVQTLHDWSLICPAHTCFVRGDVCDDCAGGRYWHGLSKACVDRSRKSTALAVAEAYLHSLLGLYRKIDWFLAPSRFLMEKVSSLGWIRDKISHLPYFIPLGDDWSTRNDGYVLFAGRITREKGVGVLLEAAQRLRDTKFVIAGEGEDLDDFRNLAVRMNLPNVEFTGYVSGDPLEKLIEGASCIAVTSVWYENLPLTILGSFARGKPVVGSDCGGIGELVRNGETGYLFRRADAASLAEAIGKLQSDESIRIRMGRNARDLVSREHSADGHYDRLMKVYGKVLK